MSGRATAVLGLAVVLGGCGGSPPPGGVLVIGIDTLRADHLSCYGYARRTSPRLDELAAQGVLFEDAISQSSWTLPAFASIMTGVLPSRHGAGEGKRCMKAPCRMLDADRVTLAEQFAQAGFRTASFVSNGFVGPKTGLGRGFEEIEVDVSGATSVAKAIAWLGRRHAEPFFLFVHVIEPHAPYAAPAEDRAMFVDPGYAGPIVAETTGFVVPTWSDADRRHIVDLYDGEVHWADRLTGRLLDELAHLGIAERTLVVVTADHGEELFERGGLGHGHSLFDELIRVPLVMRFPGGTPRGRVTQQVRTMDVFPTVLEAMGRPVPSGLDGRSLLAMARGEPADPSMAVAVSEFTHIEPERRAARKPPDKLIVDEKLDRPALFDLASDPGERTDLAGKRGERVAALRAALPRAVIRAEAGFHLIGRGGGGPQRLRVQVTNPTGTFAGSDIRGGEPGDTVTIAADRRTATIELSLDNGDADVVHLGVAPVVLSLRLDSVTNNDVALDGRRILLGRRERFSALTLPATIVASTIAVTHPEAPAPRLGTEPLLGIQAVLVGKSARLTFDAETRERLRALGYAE